MLVVVSASFGVADDLKTNSGKEYKNATVTRVEPDGILVKFSGGIVKIPFTDLSSELKEKYHYDSDAAQKFAAAANEQLKATNMQAAADSLRQKAEALLPQITFVAIVDPKEYGKWGTDADVQPCALGEGGGWVKVGNKFRGYIDERMPDGYEQGSKPVMTLYRIGHTNDTYRGSLLTMDKEKAINFLIGQVTK